MMRSMLYVSALLLPAAASAQASGPYKLVITWYQSNITVIDYPSQARCEAARRAVEAEIERRKSASAASLPAGSITIGSSPNGAFCIPG